MSNPRKILAGVLACTLIALGAYIGNVQVANATSVVYIANGGTGTSTAPTYGKLLAGDAGGNYELVGTSTLGLPTSIVGTTNQVAVAQAGTVFTVSIPSSFIVTNASTTNFTINGITSQPQQLLQINSSGNVSGFAFPIPTTDGGTGTSTWQTNSIPTFNGTYFTEDNPVFNFNAATNAIGIGTSTPGVGGLATGSSTLAIGGRVIIGATNAGDQNGTLTYGGVQLANTVTGTGSMVLSASPTFTGTLTSPLERGGNAVTSTLQLEGTSASSPTTATLFLLAATANSATTTITKKSFGFGTTTPIADFQVATSSANATTTAEFGKANQTVGSCVKLYRTDGSAIYGFIAAGATALTFTTTSCSTTTPNF